MAKLIVADPATGAIAAADAARPSGSSLREWLSGQWAVLFSHPEHFAPHPSTPAGFITLLADDFLACGVKPITVANHADAAASWLDFAGADRAVVALADGNDCSAAVIDLPERVLAQTIARMTTPFVIIIDAIARCRSTISYRPQSGGSNRTVEDVLRTVQVLRDGPRLTPAHTRLAVG